MFLLVGSACNNGGSGTDAGVDAGSDAGADAGVTCASYAATWCDLQQHCAPGTLATEFGTVADCVAARTVSCNNNLAAPGSGFTSAWLAACTPSLATQAATCASGPVPLSVPSASDPCALSGTVAGGGSCGVDGQCASGICTRVGAVCGTCDAVGQVGDGCGYATGVTCARGLSCSGTNHHCVTTVGVGATCDLGVTQACVAGTSCVRADANATGGTCQVDGTTAGVTCDPNALGAPACSASAGFFCDTTVMKCAAITYAAAGASCGSLDAGVEASCTGGSCSATGTCSARVAIGQSCTIDGAAACATNAICATAVGAFTGTCAATSITCNSPVAVTPNFTFQPSNVSLTAIDAAAVHAADENVAANCNINTDTTSPSADCFTSPITVVQQAGGTTVNLVVVRSLTVQPGATVNVSGKVPLVLVSLSDSIWYGQLVASSNGLLTFGPGGGVPASSNAVGPGAGGGLAASGTSKVGAGGGSFCGLGGSGGGATATSAAYGTADLRPLVGGSAGGGGTVGGGAGGGAVQLVAAGRVLMRTGSAVTVGGAGGLFGGIAANQNAGGGGSGGAILIEAQGVSLAGILAANGGGGGGTSNSGADAATSAVAALGGDNGNAAQAAGGAGSAGAAVNGKPGSTTANTNASGGGGGAGRIQINTSSGTTNGKGTLSPGAATTCTGFGVVRALGTGG